MASAAAVSADIDRPPIDNDVDESGGVASTIIPNNPAEEDDDDDDDDDDENEEVDDGDDDNNGSVNGQSTTLKRTSDTDKVSKENDDMIFEIQDNDAKEAQRDATEKSSSNNYYIRTDKIPVETQNIV